MSRAAATVIIIITLLTAAILSVDTARAESGKDQYLKEHLDDLIIHDNTGPMILDHGGPDDGGYYYIDSDDEAMNAPIFEWLDISDRGTLLTLGDDQNVGPFALGFDFEFYGFTFDSVRICSNGFLSFSSNSNSYINRSIPGASDPNDMIAVLWDDLVPNIAGEVYYLSEEAPDHRQRFIVSFNGVPYYPDAGALYFQVIIYDTGDIICQYQSLEHGGHTNASCTVGIENSTGLVGTQYVYNQVKLHDQLAVYFGHDAPVFADHDVRPTTIVNPAFHIQAVGDSIYPSVRFWNSGTSLESFSTRLIIDHNGEIYNETYYILGLPSGENYTVNFPFFVPSEEGAYQLSAISELGGDQLPGNDTIRTEFNAYSDIYFSDFEPDSAMFSPDNDWAWGTPQTGPNEAYSGVNLWATNLRGNYSSGPLRSTLISPPLGLLGNANLTIWHWYNCESLFDGGNVKISIDDGITWQLIFPEDGYDGILSTDYDNPLGGQEAFTGLSGGWLYSIFDLSSFGGNTARVMFDFGSDYSVEYSGWYIDDFVVYGGGASVPGLLTGVVSDQQSGDPISGAIVHAGLASAETNDSGEYEISLFPGTYLVSASAQFYSPDSIDGLEITENDTIVQNFALSAPGIQVDTTPIEANIFEGETLEFFRTISNPGQGILEYSISVEPAGRRLRISPNNKTARLPISNRPGSLVDDECTELVSTVSDLDPPMALDFGDEVFGFDPETQAGDRGCLGVEFDGRYFWVTGRYPEPGDDVHKLHKFDRDGNYLESFDQGTVSVWGWRDLAWDGTYLYASDENELAVIDPNTGDKIDELPFPFGVNPPLRGLAYDPQTDHFWAANFRSHIIEFDRSGEVHSNFQNDMGIYGLAWDNASPDGPWLWVFSQDGFPETLVSQFNPVSGQYTDVSFIAPDHGGDNNDTAGGACFTTEWNTSLGVLFCLVQGGTGGINGDLVQGYEITPYSGWLTVDPLSGRLLPSQNTELTITLDFTGDDIIPDSIYQARIVVNNNTAQTPEIPVTVDVQSGVDDEMVLPGEFALRQNYPNPFNPSTAIGFAIPEQSAVEIEIFNILGQKVDTAFDGNLPAGNHSVVWDGSKFSSGIYYYKLTAGKFNDIRKMLLVK